MRRQPVRFHLGLYNSGLLTLAAVSGWVGYSRSGSISIAIVCGLGAGLTSALCFGVMGLVHNMRQLNLLGTAFDANQLDERHYFGGRGLIAGNGGYFFVQVSSDHVYVQIGRSARRIAWSDISHIELQQLGLCTFAALRGAFSSPPGELLLPWEERFDKHIPQRVGVSRC